MKKTRKKGIRSLAILLALILAIGFSPVTNVEAKAAPRLNYRKVTLVQGKKKRLKVRNLSRRRRSKVKWYSTRKSVATVNRKGVVKAKRKGKAYIVAKVGRKKYRCKVIVKKKVRRKKKRKKPAGNMKIPKGDKKYIGLAYFFYPEKSYTVNHSLDFFTTLNDGYNGDWSKLPDSVRTKYYKWYSSDKNVIAFNRRGIASFKKTGKSTVYCKYLNKSGKWEKTRSVTIKVVNGGDVKFSYSLSLEESPFNQKTYKVWDFYKHDSYDESLPKFNTITLKIQNNSSKAITIRGLGVDTSTSQPTSVDFNTSDKTKAVIPAYCTKEIKYFSYSAEGSLDTLIYRNYVIDREVLSDIVIGYNYNGLELHAKNTFKSSTWKFY